MLVLVLTCSLAGLCYCGGVQLGHSLLLQYLLVLAKLSYWFADDRRLLWGRSFGWWWSGPRLCVCVLRPHARPVVIAICYTSICVLTYCNGDHRLFSFFFWYVCLTLVECFGTEDIVSICGDCLRRDMIVTSPFPLKREAKTKFCGNNTQVGTR